MMFPGGEPGWHSNVFKVDGGKRNKGRKHTRQEAEYASVNESSNHNSQFTGKYCHVIHSIIIKYNVKDTKTDHTLKIVVLFY